MRPQVLNDEELNSDEKKIANCMLEHSDSIVDNIIKDWYVTEENRETVRGKYFNTGYVIQQEVKLNDVISLLYKHCCISHI